MAKINPDIKAYFNYFGRGILIILGVLIIGGLIAFSYFYGGQDRDETEQVASPQEQGQAADDRATTPSSGTDVSSDNNNTGADTSPSGANGGLPAGGAETVPVTGPEDYAWIFATATILSVWYWRKSRLYLQDTQLNK